jgi:hypothetical protein
MTKITALCCLPDNKHRSPRMLANNEPLHKEHCVPGARGHIGSVGRCLMTLVGGWRYRLGVPENKILVIRRVEPNQQWDRNHPRRILGRDVRRTRKERSLGVINLSDFHRFGRTRTREVNKVGSRPSDPHGAEQIPIREDCQNTTAVEQQSDL